MAKIGPREAQLRALREASAVRSTSKARAPKATKVKRRKNSKRG